MSTEMIPNYACAASFVRRVWMDGTNKTYDNRFDTAMFWLTQYFGMTKLQAVKFILSYLQEDQRVRGVGPR